MSDNILFDNIIITDDKAVSEQWAAETFDLKRNLVDRDQVSTASRFLFLFDFLDKMMIISRRRYNL